MVIGIDFDDVINNMLDVWVDWLNDKYGMSVKHNDITGWDMSEVYPNLTKTQLYEPLNTPEFWDTVSIREDAKEVMDMLIADGHKVYVITSSYYKTLPFKLDRCLFKNFPYFSKKDIIITYNKALINVDLLIDDGEHNIKDFAGIKVIFDRPHNKNCTCADYRVASWKEFYILIKQLANKNIRPPFTRVHQFKAGRGMGKTAWLQEQIYNADVPCYVIMPDQRYKHFCESYMERYHKVCPAKLYKFNEHSSPTCSSRFFADMPSTFPVKSETFEYFKNIFLSREYLLFVADFENTYWHAV